MENFPQIIIFKNKFCCSPLATAGTAFGIRLKQIQLSRDHALCSSSWNIESFVYLIQMKVGQIGIIRKFDSISGQAPAIPSKALNTIQCWREARNYSQLWTITNIGWEQIFNELAKFPFEMSDDTLGKKLKLANSSTATWFHTRSLLECSNTNQDDTLGRHTWKLANSSTATWFQTTSLLVIITTKMDGIWWREGRRRPCESVMRHWEDAPQWLWLLIHILNKQPNIIIMINKAHIWQLHGHQY